MSLQNPFHHLQKETISDWRKEPKALKKNPHSITNQWESTSEYMKAIIIIIIIKKKTT